MLRIAKTCRPETLAWWKTWAGSPNSTTFTPVMWQRLQMLAVLVDAFFGAPTAAAMAEIRRAEAEFGAMPGDRARLRWDMPQPTVDRRRRPATEEKPGVRDMKDFAQRRRAAVEEMLLREQGDHPA